MWWPQGRRPFHRALRLLKPELQASPDCYSEATLPHRSCTLLVELVPSPSRVGTQGPPLKRSSAKESADMTEGHCAQIGILCTF